MIPVVQVSGNKNTTFVEGTNYKVVFTGKNGKQSNNTSKRHVYSKNNNSVKIMLSFKASDDVLTNYRYISKDENDEFFLETKSINIKPFNDDKRTFILTKDKRILTAIDRFSNGKNLRFLENETKAFFDGEIQSSESVLYDDKTNPQVNYPYTHNYYRYLNSGGRIDPTSSIKKLIGSQDEIDDITGFRGHCFNSGISAFGENNNIKNYIDKYEETSVPFEDDIIDSYLYNKNVKSVIKIQDVIRNPITGEETFNTVTFNKIKHSNDPRYFSSIRAKIKPFYDVSYDDNYFWLDGEDYVKNNLTIKRKENLYKANENNINNYLVSARRKNDTIKEDRKYYSTGRSLDKSLNIKTDSLGFFGEQN